MADAASRSLSLGLSEFVLFLFEGLTSGMSGTSRGEGMLFGCGCVALDVHESSGSAATFPHLSAAMSYTGSYSGLHVGIWC